MEFTMKNFRDFEDINDAVTYLNIGSTLFENLSKLSVLIKEGTKLTENYKEKLKESGTVVEKTEIFKTAINDLSDLIAQFVTKTDK